VSVSERKSYCHSHQPSSPEMGGGTHNIIILDTIRLAPRTHDKRIVVGNDGHGINALAFDCAQIVDVAGEMLRGAAGGESAWDGKYDDFLVGPFCSSCVLVSVKETWVWRGSEVI